MGDVTDSGLGFDEPLDRRTLLGKAAVAGGVIAAGGLLTAGRASAGPAAAAGDVSIFFGQFGAIAEQEGIRKFVFRGFNGDVDAAFDGREALEALARRRYDVVLLDIQMPEVDGLEVARRVVATEPDPAQRPWMIAVTANAIVGDRETCLAAGMDDFVPKPMQPSALEAALNRAMTERPSQPGGARRVS